MTEFALHSERLTLKVTTMADAAWLQSVYSQPAVGRFLPTGPWTSEVGDAEVLKRVARTGLDSEEAALSLVARFEGRPVAELILWLTDRGHRVASIGWVGDPEYAGRGFVGEAAAAVLDYAFTEARIHRVAATIDPRNAPSFRLAERLGMRREAHLRENAFLSSEWCDSLIYGMLASDPRPWTP